MLVKMRTTISGPEGTVQAGGIYKCTEKEGKELLAGGYADLYIDNSERQENIETTEKREEGLEVAVTRKSGKEKESKSEA
jgi:hypothetical protein